MLAWTPKNDDTLKEHDNLIREYKAMIYQNEVTQTKKLLSFLDPHIFFRLRQQQARHSCCETCI